LNTQETVRARIEAWREKPPTVEAARDELQHTMGMLVFAHSARLSAEGESPTMGSALSIIDVFEAICAVADASGWDRRELPDTLQSVIDHWDAGEVIR